MKTTIFSVCFVVMGLVLQAQIDPRTKPQTDISKDPATGVEIKELYYVLKSDETVRQGPYQAYTMSDVLIRDGKYDGGKKSGTWRNHFMSAPNNLESEGDYVNGFQEGRWLFYFNSAGKAVREEAIFSNNEASKDVKIYHNPGVLKAQGRMDKAGGQYVETGYWTYWHTNGMKESEGAYAGGAKIGKWTEWFPNGKVKVEENYQYGRLNGKRLIYNDKGEFQKTEYYKSGTLDRVEDQFTDQQNKIDSLLKVSERFSTSFAAIYNNEVKSMQSQTIAYKAFPNDQAKFDRGNTIITRLNFINSKYDDMLTGQKEVSMTANNMKTAYANSYPDIYKNDIEPVWVKTQQIDAANVVEDVLKKTDDIKQEQALLQKKMDTLQSNDKSIKTEHAQVELIYKVTYPDIYANEITPFSKEVSNYYTIKSLDQRLNTGRSIMQRIEKFKTNATEMQRWDAELQQRRNLMEDAYKKDYPSIYNQLQPLVKDALDKYQKLNTADAKLSQVTALAQFLMRYENDLQKLNDQKKNIQDRFTTFDNTFKDDKENKFVHKRGQRLYEAYLVQYDQQVISTRRLAVGNEILTMLDKLIALKGQNTLDLNEKLKDTQTPEQMKDVFGF